MKTSLDHLPPAKQEEIRSITDTIVALVQPVMVILFGSYSRGNWVEDQYVENGITYTYKSDYDILVVTEKAQDAPPRLGKEIRRRVKRAENLQTTPHIIFHDIGFLNRELERGQYFFTDIIKEGTMLFDNGNHQLSSPKELSSIERGANAKQYFETCFQDANDSLRHYEYALSDASFKKAIFELHQATERYIMTILLVFTDYKPKTHDLEDLIKQAGYCDARLKTVFPINTEEEKRLFSLLCKAYIDSRYVMGYAVNAVDLQWLAQRVHLLRDLTQQVCTQKIAALEQG